MNKPQLIKKFAAESGLSDDQARDYIDILMQCIEDGLRLDGKVQIMNYFTIWVKQYESKRDIISNFDGKLYQVGKKQRLRIRPSTTVKKMLDNSEYLVTHVKRE